MIPNTPADRIGRYLQHKPSWPDQLLLLRSGDLYETFDADARAVARCLNDATTERDGHLWWCCSAEDLEPCQKRLLKAGWRVAVGDVDPEDGEVEVLESGDLPTDRPEVDVLRWPERPVKAESPEGYLLDIWACANGELRVVRAEPLNGQSGYFTAEALVAEDEDEDSWAEIDRSERLSLAFAAALAHYRGTSPERSAARAEVREAMSYARQYGLADVPLNSEPVSQNSDQIEVKSEEFDLVSDPDLVKIIGARGDPEQQENSMSDATMTEPVTAAPAFPPEAEVQQMVMPEEDARQLCLELGWKMDARDNPLSVVTEHLNSITRGMAVEDLETPTTSDSRAYLKSVIKTIRAGGRIAVTPAEETTATEEVVEEKSKRRTVVTEGAGAKTPTRKAAKAGETDRFGCRIGSQAAQINKAVGDEYMTLEEIVKKSKLPAARVKGHLKAMKQKGYVFENKDGLYRAKK